MTEPTPEQKKSDKKEIIGWITTIAEAITALAPIVKYVAVAIGTFMVMTLITPNPSDMDDFRSRLAQREAENIALVARVSQSDSVIARMNRENTTFRTQAQAASARVRELERTRPSPAVVAAQQARIDSLKESSAEATVIIEAQDVLIDTLNATVKADSLIKHELRIENDNLKKENGNLIISNSILFNENRDLRLQLSRPLPDAPSEKFLWVFDMPTRKQAFALGFVGGIVVVTAIVVASP